MQFTITHTIPDMTLEYLLDAAGRGASYWAQSALEYPHEVKKLMDGHEIEITDIEENPSKTYKLDLKKIEIGFKRMALKNPELLGEILVDAYDNNTGDVFLQYCIFGDVVYS